MDKLFHCNICDRNYNSYQSMWNHNKKFHPSQNLPIPPKSLPIPPKSLPNPPSHLLHFTYYMCINDIIITVLLNIPRNNENNN